jgi:hypothetical protein
MSDIVKAVTVVDEKTMKMGRWELMAMPQEFLAAGEITKEMAGANPATITNPGLADTLLAEISVLGHRDKFPRPYDWENLIPQLEPGEELLWVAEKQDGKCALYFGLKFGTDAPDAKISPDEPARRHKRLTVLADAMARRSFPESRMKLLSPENVVEKLEIASKNWGKQVTCVAGVPSPKEIDGDRLITERDEEKRPFASLNDVMETLNEEENFSIVFSLAKATAQELQAHFRSKAYLRDEIGPWIKREVGANKSGSHAEGTQDTKGESQGTARNEQRNVVVKLWQSLWGSSQDGTFWAPRSADSTNQSLNVSFGENTTDTWQEGSSESFTQANTLLDYLDKTLEEGMKHLQVAMGTGGFYGCAMVYAGDREASRRIGKTVAAVLSGRHSHLRPMQVLPFTGEGCMFQLNRRLATHALLAKGGVFLEPLDCEQAGRLLLLPDAELSGLEMRRSVFYGRPDMKEAKADNKIKIGTLAFSKKTITNELDGASTDNDRGALSLSPKDLYSHLLLVGTTGSGKTVRAASILNNIPAEGHRVIVLETAKKTYRNLLHRGNQAPRVYTLGDSRVFPFRLNPFYFDAGTSLKQHISVLSDALSELLPTEALIGPKLREAAEKCYTDCGWDIENGRMRAGDVKPVYPTMVDFNIAVRAVCETLEDYGPEVRANYKGALLNRARIFLDDVYQDIFAFDGDYAFADLLARDVIIEMEEMPPSEINMPAFIISMVLHRLRAYRCAVQAETERLAQAGDMDELIAYRRKHPPVLLVIEEAHNVLHRKFEQERSAHEAGKGKRLIEQVGRLMMEGRALGIGVMVVDQSPKNLSDAVIANANTKIVFRQEDGDEVKAIGTAMGIPEKDWSDLQRLTNGECVVKSKAWSSPVKLAELDECECPKVIHHEECAGAVHAAMPYAEVIRLLNREENGWSPSPSNASETAKQILYACSDEFPLIRFLLAKHWISKGDFYRAGAALKVYDYGALKRHLRVCAKPDGQLEAFLTIIHASLSSAMSGKCTAILDKLRAYGNLDLFAKAAGHFLDELERMIATKHFNKMPPDHPFFDFRDAVGLWVEALMNGCSDGNNQSVDELDRVRKKSVPIAEEINTLLATVC